MWTQSYFEIKYFISFQTSAGLGAHVNSALQQVPLQTTYCVSRLASSEACASLNLQKEVALFSEAARWEAGKHSRVGIIFSDVDVVGSIKCY